jgi:hypothetical protein
VVPSWQTSLSSQQPMQVAALQAPEWPTPHAAMASRPQAKTRERMSLGQTLGARRMCN